MNYYQEKWQGSFGDTYTDRCIIDYKPRISIFKKLFNGLKLGNVLEVGANMGHNLKAIEEGLFFNDSGIPRVYGLDINYYAIEKSDMKDSIVLGSAYDLPWVDNSFDLVFTAGVLIHENDEMLTRGMSEMHRVSKKYILSIEHIEKERRAIKYRDFQDKEGMWARDYTKLWRDNFKMKIIKEGNMKDFGVDDKWNFTTSCQYVLLEKT